MKFKPCPFCGNTDIFVRAHNLSENDNDSSHYTAVCNARNHGCGASVGCYEEAVDRWNKRDAAKTG